MASPAALSRSFLAIAAFLLAALLASAQSPQPSPDHARVPVLVELFTSEGCSDCPPADRLLEQLDTTQPIPHAQAIVLSEHVTYWNHQGWIDPFSFDEIDLRQKEYGDQFRLESVYTPQAVIDGTTQLVGNNGPGLAKAVEQAASMPKKPITISDAHWEQNAVTFSVHAPVDSGVKLVAVVAADATGKKITSGENTGRTIHHVAVVRTIREFNASAADGRPLRLSGGSLSHDQTASPVRLIVFLFEKKTGHVIAVSEQTLSR
jgi:hypothetical protein